MTGRKFYEFGPYRIDPGRNLLLRGGQTIPLTPKAFETLLILVERGDQEVSKDELIRQLWPDTFVEESNLTKHISMVRKALGESAQDHRYILTLPGRGYRFAEKVSTIPEAAMEVPLESRALSGMAIERTEQVDAEAPAILAPRKSRRRRWTGIVAAMAMVALLIIGSSLILHRRTSMALGETDSVVVAEFVNTTGDAVFDDTLKTGLDVSLRQSPFLDLLPDSQVAKILQLMALPAGTKLTPDVARELCLRAGSKAYIAGSIGNLGSAYVLGLRAVNCQNGDALAEELMTAVSKEKVLDTLGDAAARLRGKLGESLATVQKFDVPLAQATTASLEALKAYSLGNKAYDEKGMTEALFSFLRAIALDPNFAMAYLIAGDVYGSLSEPVRSKEYITKAFQLREHASERERLVITATYYAYATGERDKAMGAYREQIESYPREPSGYIYVGLMLASLGQYEKAGEITRQSLRIAPDHVGSYVNLANYAMALQRFDETRQIIHEQPTRNSDNFVLRSVLYALAFIGSDFAGMTEQQQWFAGKPAYESFGLALAADTEAYGGRLGKARGLTKRAVDSAIAADSMESGAIWQAIAAQREAAYGKAAEAGQSAAAALKLASASQGAGVEAALAFAMAGDTARAEFMAQDLGKRFHLDTQMQSLWLPAIRAQVALNRKDPALALNTLEAATQMELGQVAFVANLSCLYPVYVRGEAYLAAGQGSAAAAEFQKILDHNGIVWNCWTGALAHLGLARANALRARTLQGQGQAAAARMRARSTYKDFLTLWKDADPDIPILKQAKSEYARLQ